MKGAGFFSTFPKDLQRFMYRTIFDETTRVMLVCATLPNRQIIAYLKHKLDTRCPINWFEWATCHGYDYIVQWSEFIGVGSVGYHTIINAVPYGPVSRYLSPCMYSRSQIVFIKHIMGTGHRENIKWLMDWQLTRVHMNAENSFSMAKFYNVSISGVIAYSKDEARSTRVIDDIVNRVKGSNLVLDQLSLESVASKWSPVMWDFLIKHQLLVISGQFVPSCLIVSEDTSKIDVLLQRGAVWNAADSFFVVRGRSSLEFLKWILQKQFPFSRKSIAHLMSCVDGGFEFVKHWMQETKNQVTLEQVLEAVSRHRFECLPWVATTQSDYFCLQVVKRLVMSNFWDALGVFASRNLIKDIADAVVWVQAETQKAKVETLNRLVKELYLPPMTKSALLTLVRNQKRRKKE